MEGKFLIIAGVVLVVLGLAFSGKLGPLGRLPGDFSYSSGNVSIFFPLATMLILSLVLTLILNLFR
jgi:ABC-type hemin transport system ATPase subunit